MDATDGAMKAQECRSCGGGDDEHCVNERVGAARRRVRTFRTHAPSISLPPRNDFLQKGEMGDEGARERGAREFQSDEDEERALGGA